MKDKELYYYDPKRIGKTTGAHDRITGDTSNLFGDCSKIYGNVQMLSGCVNNIRGDVSRIWGNVSCLNGDVSDIMGDVTGQTGTTRKIKNNPGLENDVTDKDREQYSRKSKIIKKCLDK